jgi:hypothetical protein
MSYEHPTPAIGHLRDMLFACPTVIGLGWTTAQYHYPRATPIGDSGQTIDALPLFEAEDHGLSYSSNIAGGAALSNGRLTLTLVATLTVGQLEAICQAIAKELRNLQTGLPINDAQPSMASDVTIAAEAAQDSASAAVGQIAYRSCSIDISYGLSY